MAHPQGAKERGRKRILEGAGRGFRAHGYGGIGVDGLAKAAGVTSGAFYAHFKSKAEVFEAAVVAGLEELRAAILAFRAEGGDWPARLVDFYMGERRTCDLGQSCGLQALTTEVARSTPEIRAAYEAKWEEVVAALAEGLAEQGIAEPGATARTMLALLSGGVSVARAVRSDEESAAIAESVKAAAAALLGAPR